MPPSPEYSTTVAETGVEPTSHVDLGGGTGAAAWAAAEAFASLETITVLDQADEALRLGQRLVERRTGGCAATGALHPCRRRVVATAAADLVTVSYVLSELDADQQARLVADAMAMGEAVVVVEPGTPDGYERILLVRDAIRDAGWQLLGPCPHAEECPLARGTGATSRLGSTDRRSTAGSRAASCPTRTRSSRGSRQRDREPLPRKRVQDASCDIL